MSRLLPGLCAGLFIASALLASPVLAACGRASYYCCADHGRATASGEIFNQNAMTAAVPRRSQFGTYRVTSGGKSVTVRANDTGGFAKYGRIIDLSQAAFVALAGSTAPGLIKVCIEKVN